MSVNSLHKRPHTVTLVLWGVILFGVWNAGRALVLFKQRFVLIELQIRPSPWIQILFALGWVVLFWGCAYGLRQKRPFSPKAVPTLIALYALYDLGIRFLFAPSRNQSTWTLTGIFFISCVLLSYWALNRKAAKLYFKESDFVG